MSSSNDNEKPKKVDIEKVETLINHFLDIIEGTLNTVDHIAEVNTETHDGTKYIKAGRFRMNIRQLKVQLLKDLARKEKL